MSRCIYIYCETLEKGFITRLSSDQRMERLYEQVKEVLLSNSEYELVSIALSEKVLSGDWILPPFLRMKDLHFDDPVYTKAIVRRRSEPRITPDPVPSVMQSPNSQLRGKDDTAVEDQTTEHTVKSKQSKKDISRSTKKTPVTPSKKTQSTENQTMHNPPRLSAAKKFAIETETKSKKRNAKAKLTIGKMTIRKTSDNPNKKQKLKQDTLQTEKEASEEVVQVEKTQVQKDAPQQGEKMQNVRDIPSQAASEASSSDASSTVSKDVVSSSSTEESD